MSLQCLYQLGVITYFQLNHEYIAKVLCINREKPITQCNGQCFLKNKLELADDNSSESEPLPLTQKSELPIFLITENYYPLQAFVPLDQNNSPYLATISSSHRPAPFHPPALRS